MKKIFALLFTLCGFFIAHSQDACIKEVQRLTLGNDSLQKQVIKPLKDSISALNTIKELALKKMLKQLDTLKKDSAELSNKIKNLEKNVVDKNNIIIERDSLQKIIVGQNVTVSELNKKNLEKEGLIAEEKRNGELKAKAEYENGKKEALGVTITAYQSMQFDQLIKSTGKLSLQRDLQLFSNNKTLGPLLSDLEKYFNAEEMLSQKIDLVQIKSALTSLDQIKQRSPLLDKLKENIKFYKDYNDELRNTINKLIVLDTRTISDGDKNIQVLKFKEIILELSDYMYNYNDYGNYPYLSEIVLEIIKRKKKNADADVTDLVQRLQ